MTAVVSSISTTVHISESMEKSIASEVREIYQQSPNQESHQRSEESIAQYSLFENFAILKMTRFATIVLVVLVPCRGCGHACTLQSIKSNTEADNAGQLKSGKVETGSITSHSLTVDRSPLAVDSICVDMRLYVR